MIKRIVMMLFMFSCTIMSQSTVPYLKSFPSYTGECAVQINGPNIQSGVYYVPPAYRVLDVIKLAMKENYSVESLPRVIRVDSTELDIVSYILMKNKEDQNIMVYSGMNIYISIPNRYVYIKGDVLNKISKLSIKEDETVGSFVELLTFSMTADTNYIYLIRDDSTCIVRKEQYKDVKLENDDCIIVPKGKSSHYYTVTVKGEVERSGVYPIEHSKTTVGEVLREAGLLGTSDSNKIIVHRKKDEIGIQSPRPEVVTGLRNMTLSFVLDSNQVLYDGDVIEVMKRVDMVYVTGFVKHPSVIKYDSLYKVGDYIKKAGGYTRSADRENVRVVTSLGVTYMIKDVKEIRAGDVIIVPESTESKVIKTYLPVIQAISSAISVIAALISISVK